MNTAAFKKEVDTYLPLLSEKQQVLVLEMIKGLLQVDSNAQRISKEQYNQEILDAVARVESGDFVDHQEALKRLSKW
jgi:hypothetical protein